MSGDHNMNQTDSGWRKRQIALDKMAENARELGLDYEPDKTVIEMAREAGICTWLKPPSDVVERIERFAALVRADEREMCAKVCEADDPDDGSGYSMACKALAKLIKARGTHIVAQPEPVKFKCTVVDDRHPQGIPLEQWGDPPAAQPKQEPVSLADYVIGCFDAAEVEGLTAALINTDDHHLKDLVERRLMYALYAAQKLKEESK